MKGKLVAMLGLAAVVLGTVAVPALSRAESRDVATLTVFGADSAGFYKQVDEGKPGLSTEDYVFEKTPLLDLHSGDRIGTLVTRVQVVRVELEGDDALAILDGTAILPAGRIVFYGSFHTGLSFRHVAAVPFAITGGTGLYDAARGTVVTKAGKLKGAEGTVLDFEVVLG